jgi:hypothetical protein
MAKIERLKNKDIDSKIEPLVSTGYMHNIDN